MDSILYVDDEPILLELGKVYLERTNEFEVTTATSASAALNLIKTHRFQTIVSDYQMPGMNGIDFLKTVRVDDNIPFIIFTGRGREEVAVEAFENGANFYLQKGGLPKPQFAELIHKIHSAINHRRADVQVTLLNKIYSVLSATNKAIIYIDNKIELLDEICRVAVEIGGFKMAWAGFVNDESQTIEPVASHGDIDGYLDDIVISTKAIPQGNGPTGTAFRENKFNFCNDITTDPLMSTWREAAISRGFRSVAVFPFAIGTQNAGVISFYSDEIGIFNDQIIRLLEEQSGDITYALAVMDHEDRRIAAEKELIVSEQKYRRLFETAQDGILILDGESGEVIDVNKYIIDMLGYPFDYFIGKHLWELGFIKDKSLALHAFDELKTNGYIRYENLPLETEEGTVHNVEFISNVYHMGEKRIIQCNIRDISDKRETQDLLQISETRYHRLFETAQDAILILDGESGEVIDANPYILNLLHYPLDYFVGKHLWELGFFKDKSLAQKAFDELKTNGYIRYEDLPLETEDGRSIAVEFVSNVYLVNSHKIIQCNIRDITERKKAEDALALAKTKLDLLNSITRHDILNQLSTLRGYLELSMDLIHDREVKTFIEKGINSSKNIQHLVHFANDYEVIGEIAPIWQNLSSCIQKTIQSLQLGDVKVIINEPEVSVFADLLLQKVFYNLFDNTLKYGGDTLKTISISSQEKDNGLIIVVEDNGAGINVEDKKDLFTHGHGKHTGLGLFLSQEILSITGITITETGVPSKGARFEILVPKGVYRLQ